MRKFHHLFRGPEGRSYGVTFGLVCTLFLLWGFCNGLLDILNKQFQESLHISKMESGFVQFAAYFGYFVMAIPSGLLARRFGYKGGILIGLILIAFGSFWFIPATHVGTFAAFLLGLFILALGLTCLETIANPYTTVLGPAEMGATRINLAQTCNAVGTILGPFIGGYLVFSSGHGNVGMDNNSVYLPYMLVGVGVVVLSFFFFVAEIPDLKAQEESTGEVMAVPFGKPLFKRRHFVLAIAAQFLYVAAQTGIWSYFVNYVTSKDTPSLSQGMVHLLPSGWSSSLNGEDRFTDLGATRLLAFGGFVLFLVGRFTGSLLLQVFRAHATLAVFGICNVIMMVLVVFPLGWISLAALFLSFFFMSIMYPTIFALGIRGLGEYTKFGSSLIVMAIVGGAIMPIFMGWLADLFSMRVGFIMPLISFVFISAYALLWPALERHDAGHAVAN